MPPAHGREDSNYFAKVLHGEVMSQVYATMCYHMSCDQRSGEIKEWVL